MEGRLKDGVPPVLRNLSGLLRISIEMYSKVYPFYGETLVLESAPLTPRRLPDLISFPAPTVTGNYTAGTFYYPNSRPFNLSCLQIEVDCHLNGGLTSMVLSRLSTSLMSKATLTNSIDLIRHART